MKQSKYLQNGKKWTERKLEIIKKNTLPKSLIFSKIYFINLQIFTFIKKTMSLCL